MGVRTGGQGGADPQAGYGVFEECGVDADVVAHHEAPARKLRQGSAQRGVAGGRGQESEDVGVTVLGGLVEEGAVLDAAAVLDQPRGGLADDLRVEDAGSRSNENRRTLPVP
ncbi:hypothetical protein ADL06_07490 [Streptomyces sp. NRRL F-6491]|nr:hypothetical protein ADL06_07490 [Streptomyces sp. NRRL F-6491]KOX49942.1 hypothetical protein ADL08_07675 [Streptomyces sp. NRRL F-6492]